MEIVKWATGIFKADANKVYKEISNIGEKVTPKQLVDYARKNEDSELHKCFEWDNDVAAEKYRLQQAGQVIRTLYIVPQKEDAPSVRVLSKTSDINTYQPTRLFLVQEDEYENLLNRALRELEAFKNKYKNLTELESILADIDEILSA